MTKPCCFNIAERHCQDFEEHIFQSHWESFWVKAFKRALADFSESKYFLPYNISTLDDTNQFLPLFVLSSDYYDCSTLHNWFQFIQKVISFQGRFEDIHDYYVLLQETDAKKDSKLHLLSQ